MRIVGQRWKLRGACSVQTPDVPDMWTPDHRPPQPVMVHLQQICAECPVRRQCAAEAVATGAQTVVAGGLFVPERRLTRSWAAAMGKLADIAGPEYLDAAPGLGATA